MDPFPRDSRCGCPICPDCRRETPCAGCNGDCVVCQGVVPPGPTVVDSRSGKAADLRSRYVARCFKEEGNRLYSQKKYAEAERMFDKAIELIQDDVTFFSNRR